MWCLPSHDLCVPGREGGSFTAYMHETAHVRIFFVTVERGRLPPTESANLPTTWLQVTARVSFLVL